MPHLLQFIAKFLTALLPPVLLTCGLIIGVRIRFFYILHPIRLIRCLTDSSHGDGVSPARALSLSLAGTLGVGNITGVATAIACGGAGAVFWMWLSAILVMSIKYAEVCLAQLYRTPDGKAGAMYYIRRGLRTPAAGCIASAFAILLTANSLLTGTVVQVNAAARAVAEFTPLPPIICGTVFAVLAALIAAGGLRRASALTARLIPPLCGVYISVAALCLIRRHDAIPEAFRAILGGAFTRDAAGGGILGFGVSSAVRYGVTRGIFSNEAGCGTAPSAHGSANAKSPHHQGCMGIFEVFADTVVLCTVTALVILTSGITPSEDGMASALAAFAASGGMGSAAVVGGSVILFAFATVVCQSYYGIEAAEYLGRRGKAVYIPLLAVAAVAGSVIAPEVMWDMADIIIAVMTVINTLIVARSASADRQTSALLHFEG